jgi:hypothetical protein
MNLAIIDDRLLLTYISSFSLSFCYCVACLIIMMYSLLIIYYYVD